MVVAEALELLLLEKPKELGLEAGRQLGDLVEKERAPVGGFDPSDLIAHGSREGAFHVAEQLAREQLFGQGRAIDRDERAAVARALSMQREGEDALAGAALAAKEDRRVGIGDTRERFEDFSDAGRIGREVDVRCLVGQTILEIGHAPAERAPLRCLLDDVAHLCGREGLRQVIARAAADGFDRGVERRIGGDDDDVEGGGDREEARNQVEPALLVETQIEKREVEMLSLERRDRRFGRADGDDLAPDSFEAHRERGADVLLVVDDERVQDGTVLGSSHRRVEPHCTTCGPCMPAVDLGGASRGNRA